MCDQRSASFLDGLVDHPGGLLCPLVHLVRQHAAKQCRIGGGVSLAEPKKVANHAAFTIVNQLNLACRLALIVNDRDLLEVTEQTGRFQNGILEVLRRLVRRASLSASSW